MNKLCLLYLLLLFYLNAEALRKFRLISCCFISDVAVKCGRKRPKIKTNLQQIKKDDLSEFV